MNKVLALLGAVTTEVRRLKIVEGRVADQLAACKRRRDWWIDRCARWESHQRDVLVVAGAIKAIADSPRCSVDPATESIALGLLQDFRAGPPAGPSQPR